MRGALLGIFVLLMSVESYAADAGDLCELGRPAKLFAADSGKKSLGKLESKTKLTLKRLVGKRWMVQTDAGQLGYIPASWMDKVCTYTKPAPAEAKPKPQAPKGPTVAEMSSALEVSKAAAESGDTALKEAVAPQIETVKKARAARADAAPDDGRRSIRTAVYSLEVSNIPEGMGVTVTDALLAEVRKLEGVSAIGMEEITQMISLEAQKQMMGCDEGESCLAEIAGALGVDEIITGRLTEAADGRTLVLRRINQGQAEVVETVNQRLKIGNGEEFLLAIGPGVEKLYPKRANRPGTKRGVAEELVLRLNPPPIATWTTYTLYGLTAAAAAVMGGAYMQRGAAQSDLDALDTPGDSPIDPAEWSGAYDSWEQWNGVLGGAGYATVGLALSSAVISLFTDWEGYGDVED